MTGRRYPIGVYDDDPRFGLDLVGDIAAVLAAHGYPPIRGEYPGLGRDLLELHRALFRFLYTPARPSILTCVDLEVTR